MRFFLQKLGKSVGFENFQVPSRNRRWRQHGKTREIGMFSWGRRGWWERPGRTRRARDHSRALSPGFLIPLNEILRKNPPRWKNIPWEADNPNPSTPAKQGKHGQTDGIAFESFEFDKENMRKARSSMTISQRKCTFKTLNPN